MNENNKKIKEKSAEDYSDLDSFLEEVFGPTDDIEWTEEKRKRFEEINNKCPFSPTRNEWPNIKIHREELKED
ncbi:hypothetical protein mru_0056 [Methanobrevibacter ruminantium M1]|uniref:Uncharacterized protein n=1 Tax=Methanobrevibacter ruminantium (strain ATCC 35063 / DSM 1093 / JCM 13430 / OCM 146 / M1) TaxID=634498 RepID=D3E4L2_METRM|nr:hypothetical protein [Methanobrevibacter ruminantium]ADC45908.1 hypothetical protein mru_0056 [Methanobrevibacter ruminantium M1]